MPDNTTIRCLAGKGEIFQKAGSRGRQDSNRISDIGKAFFEVKPGKFICMCTVDPYPSFALETPPLFPVKACYKRPVIMHHELYLLLGVLRDIAAFYLGVFAAGKQYKTAQQQAQTGAIF